MALFKVQYLTMKAQLTAALVILSSLLSTACRDTTPVTLTVLHMNDFHYSLEAHNSFPHGLGGAARLKTLVNRRRTAAQGKPVLFLDAGDFSEGNAYFALDQGVGALNVLQQLGVDATVLGNHDFIAGPDVLTDVLAHPSAKPAVLAANLDVSAYPRGAELQQLMPGYKIFRYGSLAVGVIGVTTFEFTYASYANPMNITDPVPVLTRMTREMHSRGVQAIILLSHNSFEYNKTLARSVPWVTAVVSGHSHVKKPEPEYVVNAGRRVPVVETGQWGQFLGELTMDIRPSDGTTIIKNYTLHPVTPDLPADAGITNTVGRLRDRLGALLDQGQGDANNDFVAWNQVHLPHIEHRESILGNTLAQAYLEATKSHVALEVSALVGMGLGSGPITTTDVFNLQPHIYTPQSRSTWTIKNLTLTGAELINIFNLWLGIATQDIPFTGALNAAGIEVHYDADGGLNPVRRLFINGVLVNPGSDYTVATHDGLLLILQLANDRLHLGFNLSRLEDTGTEAWLALRHYLKKRGTLVAEDHAIGRSFKLVTADLGFDESDVDILPIPGRASGLRIKVRVRNMGMAPSPAGTRVRFQANLEQNPVTEDTRLERLTTLGTSHELPLIAPGASAEVQLDWDNPPTTGRYKIPVIVSLQNSEFDKNRRNDSLRVHVDPMASRRSFNP